MTNDLLKATTLNHCCIQVYSLTPKFKPVQVPLPTPRARAWGLYIILFTIWDHTPVHK